MNSEKYWRFCLVFKEEYYPHFRLVFKRLKLLNAFSLASVLNLDKTSLLIATKEQFSEQISQVLRAEIINFLLETYKFNYFSKNLKNLQISVKIKPILLQTLAMFDSESDAIIIEKFLKLDSCLFVDEFFRFVLKPLSQKWSEICQMIAGNAYVFASNLVFELIRFLLSKAKPKTDFLMIKSTKDEVLLQNDKNQTIFALKPKNLNQKFIVKILENYPKRLYVCLSENVSKDFSNLLYLVFKNSIKPLYFA